jgi:diaminopimelate decarboxylase
MNKLDLFPITAKINNSGHLEVGGYDCVDLVNKYGSPLYVFDESTLRHQCRSFQNEFSKRYENILVIYASKAFLNKAIANIIKDEGLGLDVVSGGELALARSVSFPADKIYFHGNNKTVNELNDALNYKLGRIVVDNFYELEMLNKLAGNRRTRQRILLRLSPGIDAHTHKHTTTGILDSKFGFPIATGQAETAVKQAISLSNLDLIGLHCHLGSPIFETDPYKMAIEVMIDFTSDMSAKYGLQLQEFSPGGGFAVQYITEQPAPSPAIYAQDIVTVLTESITRHKLANPKLIVEPGRAIVAQSGIVLYTAGASKNIPDIRNYIFVDGGMGDNIRPALYQSKYEVLVADAANTAEDSINTIAGRYCESGDILIKGAHTAPVKPGSIIAVPVAGAYAIPMSSNYNMIPRPAIIMVKQGKAKLIRKRESYADLIRLDTA